MAVKNAEDKMIDILDQWDAATDSILESMKVMGLVVVKASELPEVMIEKFMEKPTTCRVVIDGILRFDGVDRSALLTETNRGN